MTNNLKNVLITGASRGIGRAIAIELAGMGYNAVLCYQNNHDLCNEVLDLIEKSGGSASLLELDIADRASCQEKLQAYIDDNGYFFGAVCNAGICADAPFPGLEAEDWDKVIHTNLDGFYNVLKPLVMPMIRGKIGGRIVTLSSISGLIGNTGQVNYSAAKAGIIGATKALSKELAKRKITVNCVAPGIIETDMTAEIDKQMIIKHIPMRRFGQPEEIAGLVGFLFSEKASYITGQVISVNGGMV
ncbi:MAG: 3-oxoacyl-ACP reductase FabG [Methylococcales bacterium]|jgi:3-oxoacyl-[acyl-carrier protein] reductase|nr:3-oxoacyl-ACP reductase FabG [Methylococcales bacterium]